MKSLRQEKFGGEPDKVLVSGMVSSSCHCSHFCLICGMKWDDASSPGSVNLMNEFMMHHLARNSLIPKTKHPIRVSANYKLNRRTAYVIKTRMLGLQCCISHIYLRKHEMCSIFRYKQPKANKILLNL
jgi:hypothetical protein